jgi:hypothetical protein
MIVGIAAKEVWDYTNANNEVGFRLPRLITALIVSPIVFAAVQAQLIRDVLSVRGLR